MKKKIIDLCKVIAIATLITFVIYLACNIFTRAIFEKVEDREILYFVLHCVNMITYAVCFYFVRTKDLDNLITTNSQFNLQNEAKKYFEHEGKYLLCITSVLALLCEVNCFMVPDGSGVIMMALCMMIFPFYSVIEIPILRAILSLLLANIIPLLLFMYYSYRLNKKTKKPQHLGD